jgi:hypothetical protein
VISPGFKVCFFKWVNQLVPLRRGAAAGGAGFDLLVADDSVARGGDGGGPQRHHAHALGDEEEWSGVGRWGGGVFGLDVSCARGKGYLPS